MTPAEPENLAARGRKFWRDVVAVYTLSRPELELLTEVCRQLDLVELLQATLTADGPVAQGSRGQTRLHPAVAALSSVRTVLARQIAQLDLPDPDGETIPSAAQVQARKAAQARWANHVPRGRRRGAAA